MAIVELNIPNTTNSIALANGDVPFPTYTLKAPGTAGNLCKIVNFGVSNWSATVALTFYISINGVRQSPIITLVASTAGLSYNVLYNSGLHLSDADSDGNYTMIIDDDSTVELTVTSAEADLNASVFFNTLSN